MLKSVLLVGSGLGWEGVVWCMSVWGARSALLTFGEVSTDWVAA